MSVNNTLLYQNSYQINLLISVLESFVKKIKSSTTLEEKVALESEAFVVFESILSFEKNYIPVKAGTHPTLQQLKYYEDYEKVLNTNLFLLQKLVEEFVAFFNQLQLSNEDLNALIRRLGQKQAVLLFWNNSKSKFVVVEKFSHLSNIDLNESTISIHTAEQLLTLPVTGSKAIQIKDIQIGSLSNGFAGSSETELNFKNNQLKFLFDGNETTHFEYERLDDGPVYLELKVILKSKETINNIVIDTINNPELVSVHFISDHKAINIDKLLNIDYHNARNNKFLIRHLPVEASAVVLLFKSNIAQSITTKENENRNSFNVKLNSIRLNTVTYSNSGVVKSKAFPLIESLYSAKLNIESFPSDYFTIDYGLSFNSSLNKENSYQFNVPNVEALDGNDSTVNYTLNITNTNTFNIDYLTTVDDSYNIFTSHIDYTQNPFQYEVKLNKNKAYVYQPDLIKRQFNADNHVIYTAKDTAFNIPLPFNIQEYDVLNYLHVVVNGIEYTYSNSTSTPSNNEYSISADYLNVMFNENVKATSTIELFLDPEEVYFEKANGTYSAYLDFPFDPDPQKLTIHNYELTPYHDQVFLPQDKTLIKLKNNILKSSFSIRSTTVNLTEVTSIEDTETTSNSFYVDYKNGFLKLSAPLNSNKAFCNYLYYQKTDFTFDSLLIENNVPVGIVVQDDKLNVLKFTESLSEAPQTIFNFQSGNSIARIDTLSSSPNRYILSYKNIIKNSLVVSNDLFDDFANPEEVDFIDGTTEFLNLQKAQEEYTNTIEADVSGIVSFTLSAGILWYSEYALSFSSNSVFLNKKNSVSSVTSLGDYYVSSNGEVTVKVGIGNSLTAGIQLFYSYRDSSVDYRNRFSVDYKNGILHSISTMNNAATVSYELAQAYVEYSIVNNNVKYSQIEDTISLHTETLNRRQNAIKTFWIESNRTLTTTNNQYFTPFISQVALDFQ